MDEPPNEISGPEVPGTYFSLKADKVAGMESKIITCSSAKPQFKALQVEFSERLF